MTYVNHPFTGQRVLLDSLTESERVELEARYLRHQAKVEPEPVVSEAAAIVETHFLLERMKR